MKHLRFLFSLLVLTLAYSFNAQGMVFSFTMTKKTLVSNRGYMPGIDEISKIGIYFLNQDQEVIVQVGDKPVARFVNKFWSFNDKGLLVIKDDNGYLFQIGSDDKFLTVKNGDYSTLYKSPQSSSMFDTEYHSLVSYIKSSGRMKGNNATSTASNTSSTNFAGKVLDLNKMLTRPFGYTPVYGKPYTINDLANSAKSVYGWNIQTDQRTGTAFLEWPNLNGMKFQGYPVFQIRAYAYTGGEYVSDFYCKLVILNTTAEKRKVQAALKSYLKTNGWSLSSYSEDRSYYFKGNVIVECYFELREEFPGKITFCINAQTFPNAKEVKERLDSGWG